MTKLSFAALAASLLLGCATTSAPAKPFVAQGGISSTFGTASFDHDEVRGPHIDLTSRGDGSWGGTFGDGAVDVTDHGERVVGNGMMVSIDQSDANKLVITGQANNRIFRFEVSADQLLVRTDSTSFTSPRTGPGEYGVVTFHGDAAKPNPPEPQFAFTLIGAFM